MTILLNIFCFNHVVQCMVNPLPGQNLWHLMASISTSVDELSTAQEACCAQTFTVLDQITNENLTIESRLDQLVTTFTVNMCLITPIDISGNGTTISTPGAYCLVSDVVLNSASNTITFASDDIVFDLNQHLISGQSSSVSGIVINSGIDDITIKNGRVSDTIMFANASASNLFIDSINFFSSGFTCTGCSNIKLSNLSFTNSNTQSFLTAPASHVIMYNSYNGLIQNCFSVRSNASYYFFSDGVASTVGNMVFKNCISQGVTTSFFIEDQNNSLIEDCDCIGPTNAGITLQALTRNMNAIVNNCTCIKNIPSISTGGFVSTANSTIGQLIAVFNWCTSMGDTISATGNFNISYNNCSVKNTGLSTNGFSMTSTISGSLDEDSICSLNNCFASSNSNGYFFTGELSVTLYNCLAEHSQSAGFFFSDFNQSPVLLRNCTVSNFNEGYLFNNQATGLGAQVIVDNCIAQNGVTGFDATLLSFGTYCMVQNCIAENCTTGFKGGNTTSAFVLNNAAGNTTSYGTLGTHSALVRTFVQSINGRGDNLENM